MSPTHRAGDWTLVPASEKEIEQLRRHCRQLVRRRALLSAGVAALPVPGLDLLSETGLFARLMDEVNQEFGLSHAQVERLQPQFRLLVYQAALGMGGMLVGRLLTRELVLQLLRRGGSRAALRQAGKLVPLAGQLASAAVGFVAFRQIGYRHVDACAAAARQLLVARAG